VLIQWSAEMARFRLWMDSPVFVIAAQLIMKVLFVQIHFRAPQGQMILPAKMVENRTV
jgi:hypothetical protein